MTLRYLGNGDSLSHLDSEQTKQLIEHLSDVIYLAAYSPNLNPIERLWKVMNEHARKNKYFATAKDFRRSINDFFDSVLPNIGATLSGRINGNFQKFYPAS